MASLWLRSDDPSSNEPHEELALFRSRLAQALEWLESEPPDSPALAGMGKSKVLDLFASSCLERYMEKGGPDLLAESIHLLQRSLSLQPPGHPDRPRTLHNLAGIILIRYNENGEELDLSEGIQLARAALELLQPGHPDRPNSLNNLASAILKRYEQHKAELDLTEGIELRKEALKLFPPGHPNRSSALYELGSAIFMRYERDAEDSELSEGIKMHREALDLRPPAHPDRADSLRMLAGSLLARYERDRGELDLSEVIELQKETLKIRPPGHPDRLQALHTLAGTIFMRYNRTKFESDLSEGIKLTKEALELFPPDHSNRSISLNNLATAIIEQYERNSKTTDLSEAIELRREALKLTPSLHPDRSNALYMLADVITIRCERTWTSLELSEVIELLREALKLRPPGHTARLGTLSNLSDAVLIRYKQDGLQSDLSDAIEWSREALALSPPDHPYRPTALSNLATTVLERYKRDREESDLSEAIELHNEALDLRPPSHPDHSTSLNNLASMALYYGEGLDLSVVIELQRRALELCPPGHPDRSAALNNLAISIFKRYTRDRNESDLSEVIKLHNEVLDLQPPGNPHRTDSLHELASAFCFKCMESQDMSDFALAVRYQREALDAQPEGSPSWSTFASRLAGYLFGMAQLSDSSDSAADNLPAPDEIIQLLRNAAAAKTSPIPDRLQAALQWIFTAVEIDPKSALDAYQSAFTHLGSALALGQSLQARHSKLLSENVLPWPTQELAVQAALWALKNNPDPKLAVELLDQGRNVLLASVGQFRVDLSDVRQQDPALAEKFYRISRLLDSAVLTGQEISERKSSYEDATNRYNRISADWEEIVDKIRSLPGCESFLLPMPYAKLQEAAIGGPVVVVVVGEDKSTAIIVRPVGEPHTLEIPSATEEALKTLRGELEYALETLPDPSRAIRSMRNILSDLWTILVQPIVQELQDVLQVPQESRIWWYPTSWASLLPLHAAGLYKKGSPNFPDLYVSSYTPTLQALRQSRNRSSAVSNGAVGPFIVSQAQTPGQIALPSVVEEVGIVSRWSSDASLLSDDQGTKERVVEKLRGHSWIHLACHGHSDSGDPFKSHFSLHDGPLSLQDIITNDLPSADFAYLSACHSATQDRTLPDEGLTLAGGMQFAGFRSVVGTLWWMADQDAPTLAEEFYKGLAERSGEGKQFDCTKAAESLHGAVMELRKQKVPLFRWINLVHYGI